MWILRFPAPQLCVHPALMLLAEGALVGLLPSADMLVLPEIEFEAKELATLAAVVRLRPDVQVRVLPE